MSNFNKFTLSKFFNRVLMTHPHLSENTYYNLIIQIELKHEDDEKMTVLSFGECDYYDCTLMQFTADMNLSVMKFNNRFCDR